MPSYRRKTMSKKSAEEFIEAVAKDAALRKKVNEAAEDIVKVARAAGFSVTAAEIASALRAEWFEQAAETPPKKDPFKVFSETPGL
jgi:predicted ribosomally synthesized peptide with nif11-like leader